MYYLYNFGMMYSPTIAEIHAEGMDVLLLPFPEAVSGFEREKKKNDINDLQMELFTPYKRPRR